MIAVLTGDIVSSRRVPDKRKWLKRLQEIIEKRAGFATTPKWGIFRGDGFQVEMGVPAEALRVAILIRAGIKSIREFHEAGLDARIGIGIGDKGFVSKSINESDGEAYQLSGKALDSIKGGLQIKTPLPERDLATNIALRLASVIIDDWTHAEAETVWLSLSQNLTQVEMARKLKISQPAVNRRAIGAHLNEITELVSYFHGVYTETSNTKK